MGVEELLELGVGYQPTLANMAKYTAELLRGAAAGTRMRNIESDTRMRSQIAEGQDDRGDEAQPR